MTDSRGNWLNAYGVSMEPTVNDGDLVYIEPVSSVKDISPGDILLLLEDDHTHIHRAISTSRRGVYTMGDNALVMDHHLYSIAEILGVCTCKYTEGNLYYLGGINRSSINRFISGLLLFGERLYLLTYEMPGFIRNPIHKIFWMIRKNLITILIPKTQSHSSTK